MQYYRPLPPAERLRVMLDYDQLTGVLTWRIDRTGFAKKGTVAGVSKPGGYIEVKIDGLRYMAHRLIWKMMTGTDPAEEIDHRDLTPKNNAWTNLRAATRRQNAVNKGCAPRSTIGVKGVTARYVGRPIDPAARVVRGYRAQIAVGGTMRGLGEFPTIGEAHEVWKAAHLELHGEFHRA